MDASKEIDRQIAALPGWCGKHMAHLRKLIHRADPEIVEEWKWSTGVFNHDGMVCALGAFKNHVKINFFKGASLKDPDKLINAGLESKSHRSVDFFENDTIDDGQMIALIKEAVALNVKKK